MIDTHCHLTFPDFAGRVERELADAHAAGVTGCITISTTPGDAARALEIARAQERVWCAAGVHPLYSHEGGPDGFDWALLRRVANDAKCVAWGELGLDNHYPEPARETQRRVLDEQLAVIARAHAETGVVKPVVVHCREAFSDLLPVLRASGLAPERFVFHCFTGTPADARAVLDFGAMLSFTGVVTYRNAGDVRESARIVPGGRFMVETDAPFLSPEPHRGKRPCRPAWVRHVLEAIAEIRREPFDRLHEQVNRTTSAFFGIDAR